MPSLTSAAFRAAFLILAALAVAAFAFTHGAWPRDNGQYAQVDPVIRQWFDSLKNQNSTPCCSDSDGVPLQDADWRRNQDGTYAVFVEGKWIPIPPEAVLTVKNRVGTAVVWFHNGQVMCFLKGPES